MKVEKIQKLKSGKYKVQLGQETVTVHDDVLLDHHLLFKKEIDDADYQNIIQDSIRSDIYHKALNYALRKIRSKKEMTSFLDSYDLSEQEKKAMIQQLEKSGVLSDLAYVKAYISDSLYLSNDGPNKIEQELYAQDIDNQMIQEELDQIDRDYVHEKLEKLIQKRVSHDHKHSKYQLQQKIVLDMVNLGYERDMVLGILSSMTFSDTEQLEKEYENSMRKLVRKYEGSILEKKIKEKLYSKGFDIHEIESFLDKKKSENF